MFCLESAIGALYVTNEGHRFVSGHIRFRRKTIGQYPFRYKKVLEEIFGMCRSDGQEIEVCSDWVRNRPNLMTVDINPDRHPVHVGNGQSLPSDWDSRFDKWYYVPPYNKRTAEKMYGTKLPSWSTLLTECARVTKLGRLLFLLFGDVNLQ